MKSATVDDFGGISFSPVLSEVLEHCILVRYERLLKIAIISLDLRNLLVVLKPFMLSGM